MSIADKLSAMFDDVMEKAIEHHRQSFIYRQSYKTKIVQDQVPPEQSTAAQADIDAAQDTVQETAQRHQRAANRLQRARIAAQGNALLLANPAVAHRARSAASMNRRVRRAEKAERKARIAADRAPEKLRRAKEKADSLGKREEREVLPPTKEQKDAALGRAMDRVLETKGMVGANLSDIFGSMRGNPEAKINMMGAGVSQMLEGMQGVKNSFGANNGPTEAAGGVLRTVSGSLMASGNPYAMTAGAVLKLGEAAVKSVDHLRDWGEALHQANIRFADYSPAMAVVKAEQQVRDIMYSQDRGEARAASADRLAKAKHELNLAMAPAEDAWQIAKNNIAASLMQTVVPLVKATSSLTARLAVWTAQNVAGAGFLAGWAAGPPKPEDDENKKEKAMSFGQYLIDQQKKYGRRDLK